MRTTTMPAAPMTSRRRRGPTDTAGRADRLIESVVRRHRIPGLSVAIVDDQGPVHTNGYGFADLATGTPATPETSYLWFSLTKIATATSARQLADAGRLDLAAPVTDYLDVGPTRRRRGVAVPSVGQLLNHTAGYPNPLPTRWVRPATSPPVEARAFARRQIEKHGRPKHPVGDRARYSNIGYLILGEVITRAAGQPYEKYVTTALLEPAGMAKTGFTHRSPAAAATPYVRVPAGAGPLLRLVFPRQLIGPRVGRYITLAPFYVTGASYGGLVGTVADAGRFASMHLADGTIDGHEVVTSSTARQMRDINTPGARDFGQGWFRAAAHRGQEPAYAEHLGAGGGFYNAMRIYPDLNLGIVTMANTTSPYPHHQLFDQLVQLDW